MQKANTLSILKYSLIAFPLAFSGIPIYIHSPNFYATNVGINIEIIGLCLLFLRLLDAFLDPFIGRYSDLNFKCRDKIVYLGTLLLIIGFWMIFHPIQTYVITWFCLSVFLCTFGFSLISINIQAFGSLWDVSKEKITKVIVTREGMTLLGLLFASVAPSILFYKYGNRNFHILSIVLIFIFFVALLYFRKWHKKAIIKVPSSSVKKLSFKSIFLDSSVNYFFSAYFFSSFAAAIPAILIIFYVRDYLRAESFLGLFLLIYFLSGAVSMPIWRLLSSATSVTFAWFVSMILAVLVFSWAYWLEPNNINGFAIICLFSGMSVGANLALPSAIIAEYISSKNHQEYASSYYSISNFLSKLSLAIASGTVLPFLGVMGYQPGFERADNLFPLLYALIPCLIQLAAISLLIPVMRSKRER